MHPDGEELSDVADRSLQRFIGNEVRKQVNIENIAQMAAERLKDDARPDSVEPDFMANVFDKAANVSDEEMQSLWASIVAGESNAPGSLSKRTIEIVNTLDKSDANLFTIFCSCCTDWGDELRAIFPQDKNEMLEALGLSFDSLVHLEALGLIRYEPLSGYKVTVKARNPSEPASHVVKYFETPYLINFEKPEGGIDVGCAMLTTAGRQLAKISGAERIDKVQRIIERALIGDGRWVARPIRLLARSSSG